MYYHQPEEYNQGEGHADYRAETGQNEFDYYPTTTPPAPATGLRGWIARNIIAADPNSQYTRLDHLDLNRGAA